MSLDLFFAESVLRRFGPPDSRSDVSKMAFLSAVMEASRQGHLCWEPQEEALIRAGISFPSQIIEEGNEEVLFPKAPVVRHQNRYYLQRNWVLETYLLKQIARLQALAAPPSCDEALFHRELKRLEEAGKLLPEQAAALKAVFSRPFSLICGGPGTGKTYLAGFLVRLLALSCNREGHRESKARYKIAAAAPTGKAAAHLYAKLLAQAEAFPPGVDLQASTVHKLLRIKPGENRLFAGTPIDADLVLVDEASMLDAFLLAQLLEAIGPSTRLVLLGDPDQLPPIDAGAFFPDLASRLAVFLERPMRTEDAQLQTFARAVNQGNAEEAEQLLQAGHPSLKRLPGCFDQGLISRLAERIEFSPSSNPPDPALLLQAFDRFRILCALRQGPFGIDALNRQILQTLAKQVKPGQWWGIPILATANDAQRELYNGTCGVLIGKSRGGIEFREGTAYFPDASGALKAFPNPHPVFERAFCLSIHQSQGSEYETVLALFPQGSESFGREAIYTAATRAKKETRNGLR